MNINEKFPMVRCIARIVVHSEEYTLFEIKIMHHNKPCHVIVRININKTDMNNKMTRY